LGRVGVSLVYAVIVTDEAMWPLIPPLGVVEGWRQP
jgi:hypothetical protein